MDRYRSFIEVTGQLGWTTDVEGKVVEDIPSWRAYTGQTQEEIMGWGWSKALHPDDLERTEQIWGKAVAEKSSYEAEYRIRRHDGVYRNFLASGIPMIDEDGSVREWIGTCIDITERKQAEEELRRINSFNQSIIDSSRDCIKMLDMDGRLQYMSPGGQRLLKIKDMGEYLNVPYEEFWKGTDHEAVIKVLRDAKQGQSGSFQGFCPTADGTPKWWDVSISPVLGADGRPERLLAISRDITERTKSEQILKARLRMLENIDPKPLEDAMRLAVDVIEEETESTIGFYHFVKADQQTLTLKAWSTNTTQKMCSADGKGSHYDINKAGVWADCVRQGKAVIHNDYESLPNRKGMPEGLAAIKRELAVPIYRKGNIVAIAGVGNKATDYDDADIEMASLLADFSWEIIDRKRAEEAIVKSEARLVKSQEIAHLGSWELDLIENQLTWSDEVYRIFGLQPQEFAATYEAFLEAVHPDDRAAVDAAYTDSVRDGKDGYEIEHKVFRKSSGEIRYVHEKCDHTRDSSGEVILSRGMVHDITERKQAEESLRRAVGDMQAYATRLSLLHEIGLTLNRETDPGKLLDSVLRSATEMTSAGIGAMLLIREGLTELRSLHYARWYQDRCSVLEDASNLHRQLGRLISGKDNNVVRIPDFSSENEKAKLPEGHPRLRGLLIGLLKDPKDRILGYILLSEKAGGADFTADDEQIISLLASQSSVALISAENLRREHLVAETLQSSLLPEVPDNDVLDIGLLYHAAGNLSKIGGDFYDFVDLGANKFAIAIGDFSGHGLEAAGHSAMVKYTLRSYLDEGLTPGECLGKINPVVARYLPPDKFITLGLAILDMENKSVSFSLAGHPPPVMYSAGKCIELTPPRTIPLGVMEDFVFPTQETGINSDMTLLMFTDGLIEAMSEEGQQFGLERLHDELTDASMPTSQAVAVKLVSRVEEFAGYNLQDDLALVVVRHR